MTISPVIATPQYTKLRSSSYAGEQLISLFSNRVVFQAEVNEDLTTPDAWAQFAYHNVTVGAYTDVRVGQVLYIGVANDIKQATFYGRIRKATTNTTIYCNESSIDFFTGCHVWVVDRHDIQYRLSRPSTNDPATAVELVDDDVTFQRPLPVIVGLKSAYVGYANTSTNKIRRGFDVTNSYAGESGATIASYAYTFSSGALVDGSLSGPLCIMDFAPGIEIYGECAVTDSGGRVQTRYFAIKTHDGAHPPDTGFQGATIDDSLDRGWTMSIPAFADVNSVLSNTFAIAWRNNEVYGGASGALFGGGTAAISNKALTSNVATLTSAAHPFAVGQTVIVYTNDSIFNGTFLITATTTNTFSFAKTHANVGSASASGTAVVNPDNVDFVGWLMREDDPIQSDPLFSVLASANFNFTGIGPRMAWLTAQLLPVVNKASPTVWGEMVNATPYRGIVNFLQYYTTALMIADLSFDAFDSTYLFPAMSTQGGNILSAISGLAGQINAVVEFAADGPMYIARDVAYLTTGERALLTTIADWQEQDALNVSRSIDPNANIGKLDADGAFYNTDNTQVTVFTARAPGYAQGEAAGSDTLTAQILEATNVAATASLKLRLRAGAKFNFSNTNDFLDADHPDGYIGTKFRASRSQVYTWTITNTLAHGNDVNRVVYDNQTDWTIDSVNMRFDETIGGFAVKPRYRRVCDAAQAGIDTTVNIPAQNEIPLPPDIPIPPLPDQYPEVTYPDDGLDSVNPSSQTPPPGKIAWLNGQELHIKSNTKAYYLKSLIALKAPVAVDITPPGLAPFTIRAILTDPLSLNTAIGCYLLVSDGTNSYVLYNPNTATPGAYANWSAGDQIVGEYTVLRAGNVAGQIEAYAPSSTTTSTGITYDFSLNDGGWIQDPARVGGPYGAYSAGAWRTQANGVPQQVMSILVNLSTPMNVTSLRIVYHCDTAALGGSRLIQSNGGTGESQHFLNTNAGDFDDTFSALPDTSETQILVSLDTNLNTPNNVTKVVVNGTVPSGLSAVNYSPDYGATWNGAQSVGTSPGAVGGFDLQRAGGVSYAGCAAKVRKATALGGGYADFVACTGANPVCVIVPYYKRNSSTFNTSTSTPDVIIALNTPDSGGGTLYWVDGATAVKTDITPVAGMTFDNANCVTVRYGKNIAVFGLVGGVYKLYTSLDGGGTWTLRGTVTSPTFIRCRRNDSRPAGVNKGQLYLASASPSTVGYSSVWASGGGSVAGLWSRTMPVTDINGFDTII